MKIKLLNSEEEKAPNEHKIVGNFGHKKTIKKMGTVAPK